MTPLHYAFAGGSARLSEVTKLLLEAGAQLDTPNFQGARPLDLLSRSPAEPNHATQWNGTGAVRGNTHTVESALFVWGAGCGGKVVTER
jgi:hypothetical protein